MAITRSSSAASELGIVLPHAGRSVVDRLARAAEEAGLDWLVARAGDGGDALVVAAFAAAATRRIRIATTGLALPARGTGAVAVAARTVDDLSGGRFALGVGDAGGGPDRAYDARLRELRTGPAAALPLMIGGATRAAVERVARVGDALVLPPGATPGDVSVAHAMLREGWRWHDRGGAPRVVAFAPAAGDLLADLRDAGAATVALTGVADADALERAVATLGR